MTSPSLLRYEPKRHGQGSAKVLMCVKGLSNPGGGAERVLADVASGLIQRGHQVTVMSFDAPDAEPFYPLHPNIKTIALGLGPTKDPATLWLTLRRIFVLRSEIRRQSPDIVIGFMHSMFIPLALAMIGLSMPLVASEHTVYDYYENRILERLFLLIVPKLTNLVSCVSEQVKSTYPAFLRNHMEVIPNPVNLRMTTMADTVARSRKRKVLLTVGRLDSGKDHETLINAFARIADRLPDWDLRIVGEGPLRSKLEEQIVALGLSKRVRLPGTTRRISKEYQKAQLFVIPSRYESFSMTTIEALAHGLPVIGFSDCPGVNQFIRTGKNGVLVEPGRDRAASLARALLPLMENGQLRQRFAVASTIPEEYDLDRVIDKWESIVHSLVKGKFSGSFSARTNGPEGEA
jgi:glycosyltransferase involved in cell wall biosynthesis